MTLACYGALELVGVIIIIIIISMPVPDASALNISLGLY